MKKVLRYLLITVGIIVIAAGAFAAFVSFRGIPKHKAEHVDLKVKSTPARIVRGQRMASLLCAGCHMNAKTGKLTGRLMNDIPQFGTIYSKNITQDPEYGIGKWSDGEIAYLLRTGIKPDGTYLPVMAKLSRVSDEDMSSIIAFLRSPNAWVAPDKAHASKVGIFFPGEIFNQRRFGKTINLSQTTRSRTRHYRCGKMGPLQLL